MWRRIIWTFLLGLVAALLIISDYISKTKIQLTSQELLFSVIALWLRLMVVYGDWIIAAIVFMHFMKIGCIRRRLLFLLNQRQSSPADLQDRYKEKWGSEVRLNDIFEALKKPLVEKLITVLDGDQITGTSQIVISLKGQSFLRGLGQIE